MGRVLGGTVNIFLSLLLGAVVFATIGWKFPEAMQSLLQSGGWVEDKIDQSGLPAEMNIWVMFLIQSEQIVFMGFVIISRIVLALLFGGIGRMLGMGRRY